MIDFTNPDPRYWFKPEFARPKEIPDSAKIRYYIFNKKRKRVKVWTERGHSFVLINGVIWRTIKTTMDGMIDVVKDQLTPNIKNLFERDDIFYSLINKR